jgi:periplasmic protein TonB
MSYHAKKSFFQRFSGLIFVVGLHVVAIFGLILGLKPSGDEQLIENVKVETVEEQKDQVEPPPPPPPDYIPPPPDFAPPPTFNVAADAPAPVNAITTVPVKPVEAPPPQPKVASPAKVPKKGLSRPDYPGESKKLGEEGVVGLALYLNEDGKVQDAKIEKTSGFERLDNAAVKQALKSWKFEPCTDDGKPVACWYKINFRWQLKDA